MTLDQEKQDTLDIIIIKQYSIFHLKIDFLLSLGLEIFQNLLILLKWKVKLY
jgi:hypothetical protein